MLLNHHKVQIREASSAVLCARDIKITTNNRWHKDKSTESRWLLILATRANFNSTKLHQTWYSIANSQWYQTGTQPQNNYQMLKHSRKTLRMDSSLWNLIKYSWTRTHSSRPMSKRRCKASSNSCFSNNRIKLNIMHNSNQSMDKLSIQ